MSSLLKLKMPIPERQVMVSDSEEFAVRGLSPLDVFSLWKRHAGQLGGLFDRVIASVRDNGAADANDIQTVIVSLMQDAPEILAEMIVLGTGGAISNVVEFDQAVKIARQLPLPVQADAVTKIGELTFTSDITPGKFAALVIGLTGKVTRAVKQNIPQISQNGSGVSVET